MKKILYIASILLLGAVACTREANEPVVERPVAENKGMVAVTMGLRVPVEITAKTRADGRAHLPEIDAIRVAVFGTSSYPQAYELATPVNKGTDATGKTVYTPGSYASTNDVDPEDANDIYYFKVLLPVYEGEAIVHIVANGDESIDFLNGTENGIMSKMVTTDNVGGYWARVVLPDGILAQTNTDGIMQTDDDGNYIPTEETARLFEDLVLVRNFAEIKLIVGEDAGISDVTWALVNDPVNGSLAPMVGTEFVADYKDYVYYPLKGTMVLPEEDPATGKRTPRYDTDGSMLNIEKTYFGYMVSNTLNTLPAAEDDLNWKEADKSQFSYERVDPNKTNPTYIMMRCKYGDDSDYSYYRVDLMDENVGGYFPLYRNYMYQIKIDLVGNRGASTFTEAANRNSGGNVSMSAETKTLTDVSDGFSRMYVEFVEKTYTTGGQKSFWVYYIPDVSTGVVDNTSIEVSVKDMGTALANATITKDEDRSDDTGDGAMYFFNFTLNDQDDDVDLTSVIQVKASNGESGAQKSTLYRDITVKVMKKMDMTLALEPNTLPEGINKNTVLHIELADTLQQSMFPLEFYIEDQNRTLNPTGKDGAGNSIDVPVKVGPSIIDPNDEHSYFFIRTVNWSEYEPMRDAWIAAKEAGTSTDGIIDFTTQFKTVEENSATTIYVDNEYFNMKSIDLACAEFAVSTTLSTVSYQAGSTTVTVSTDDDIEWTATVDNEAAGLTRAAGTLTITGQGTESFTINYDANTTAQDRVFTITVSAAGFENATTTVTQRRAPAVPATFNRNSFSSGTSSSDSSDGYLTVALNDLTRGGDYLGASRGNTITFTPKYGVAITEIIITYANSNNRLDTAPTFSSGTPVTSGASVTWTGTSASPITYTCGRDGSRITNISIRYQ